METFNMLRNFQVNVALDRLSQHWTKTMHAFFSALAEEKFGALFFQMPFVAFVSPETACVNAAVQEAFARGSVALSRSEQWTPDVQALLQAACVEKGLLMLKDIWPDSELVQRYHVANAAVKPQWKKFQRWMCERSFLSECWALKEVFE